MKREERQSVMRGLVMLGQLSMSFTSSLQPDLCTQALLVKCGISSAISWLKTFHFGLHRGEFYLVKLWRQSNKTEFEARFFKAVFICHKYSFLTSLFVGSITRATALTLRLLCRKDSPCWSGWPNEKGICPKGAAGWANAGTGCLINCAIMAWVPWRNDAMP